MTHMTFSAYRVDHHPAPDTHHRAVEFCTRAARWLVTDAGEVSVWDDVAGHYSISLARTLPASRVAWVRGRGLAALRRGR